MQDNRAKWTLFGASILLAAEKYGKWTFLVSHESLSEKLACRFTLVNLEECK